MQLSVTASFPGAGNVRFALKGTVYQNNSLVTLEDIGEAGDALLCKTIQTACCRSGSYIGNWLFPNGTRVPTSWGIYRTRGEMVVHLHRRRGGVEGIYCCEIPDSVNVIQSIYIGVYTANTSDGEEYVY